MSHRRHIGGVNKLRALPNYCDDTTNHFIAKVTTLVNHR